MAIEFKETSTLGDGWSLEVKHALSLLGHLRRRPDTGAFHYFRGPYNELSPSYENADLDALKAQIKNNP